MATYSGGCRCSAVRYEVSAEPMMMLQCQCTECQHATGSGHADWVIFPSAATKIEGKPAKFNRPTDSGKAFSQEFCPHCGSPLFGRPSGMPEGVGMLAGSLDNPSVFKPQVVVYTDSGHTWDQIDQSVAKFAKMPPQQPR